jgi:MerR family transcriptional regulator, light-induced transcriptional regulator
MKDWISTTEAAKRFGISSSTFKRFCDRNNIPVARTPGGHWRIHECHIEIVAGLWKTIPSQNQVGLNSEELGNLLLAADANSILEKLLVLTSDPIHLTEILEDYLIPCLWFIGDRWYRGEISIAEEKVATSTANQVLDSLASRLISKDANRLAVGCSLLPSIDTIGSKLVGIGLKAVGIKAIDLGGSVALEFLIDAAIRYSADIVWVSYTHTIDHKTFLEQQCEIQAKLSSNCRVIIGGGGLAPSLRRLVSNTVYYESITEMMQKEKQFTIPTR